MQVRTRASSCITTQTDRITSLHVLVLVHQSLGHMSVDGLQAIMVANHHIVTVAGSLVVGHTDLSIEGSTDGVTDINLHVNTLVHTSPTATVVTGYNPAGCRHMVATEVDPEGIRQFSSTVCILIAPF